MAINIVSENKNTLKSKEIVFPDKMLNYNTK